MWGLDRDNRDLLLLGNPISGRGLVARHLDEVAREFQACGLSVHVVRTAGPGHARRAAQEFGGGVIVSFGGDGTFNEVLNGADLDRCVLGVLPAGTGNVLAKEIGLRARPVADARALIAGKIVRLDLGVCNARRFICVFGAGMDAHVVELVHRARQGNLTQFHYVPIAVRGTLRPERWAMDVSVDGEVVARGVNVVCVGNTHSYGGPMEMTPAASPTDGLLDVMAMRIESPTEAWQPLTAMFLRSLHVSRSARYARGRRVRVVSARADVPWEVDGDLGGHLPADLRCEPAGMSLLVPARFRTRAKGYRAPGD